MVSCTYNFAVVLQSVFKFSYNRALYINGVSQDVTERHDIGKFEWPTDILSNT